MERSFTHLRYLIALFYMFILLLVQALVNHRTLGVLSLQGIVLVFFPMVFIYAFRGFDEQSLYSLKKSYRNFLMGSLLGFGAGSLVMLLFPGQYQARLLITSFLAGAFLLPAACSLFFRLLVGSFKTTDYLVLGKEEECREYILELEENLTGIGRFLGCLDPETGMYNDQRNYPRGLKPHYLVASYPYSEETLNKVREETGLCGVPVKYLPVLYEEAAKRIPVDLLERFREYYFLEFSRVRLSNMKRVADVLISFFGLVILLPAFLVISMFILLEDGWPIFYLQERVGYRKRRFTIYKFRSMYKEKEKGKARYATEQSSKITRTGRTMRPVRLDEIPQFLNILLGHMSFIGPRPEQPQFAEELAEAIPFYNYRHLLKTGLTGWAQINYQYAATEAEQRKKLSYDLYYVKNRNLLLDGKILLKTIETVVFRRGAK